MIESKNRAEKIRQAERDKIEEEERLAREEERSAREKVDLKAQQIEAAIELKRL